MDDVNSDSRFIINGKLEFIRPKKTTFSPQQLLIFELENKEHLPK